MTYAVQSRRNTFSRAGFRVLKRGASALTRRLKRHRGPALGVGAAVGVGHAIYSATRASKRKGRSSKMMNIGSGATKSYTSKYNKAPRYLSRQMQNENKQYRVEDVLTRLTATVGRQSINTVMYLCNQSDLQNQFSAAGSNPTGRWLINNCSAYIEMHNQANVGAKIWIYDVMCKQDGAVAPNTDWVTGFETDEGGAVGSATYPFATPNQSVQFKKNWKIHKVTRVELDAGSSHVHKVSYSVNKVMSKDRYEKVAANGVYAGYTMATMVVTLGSLDNDQQAKTQVSYGLTAVNIYVKRIHRFSFSAQNVTQVNASTTLPTAFTVAESAMAEDTDTTVAFASA